MAETMQYIDYGQGGGPDVLRLATTSQPTAGPGEVLIRVAFAGINRPDCGQRIGRYPPPPGASPILGLEVSGTIEALGHGVEGWKVGDTVCALVPGGGYAEYCTAPATHCLPIPAGCTLAQAAALPEALFTVWDNLFERARLQPGEILLVHGASGGVGSAAVQLASRKGIRVIALAGSAAKAEACREWGAHAVIQYRKEDFVAKTLALTDGRGADVILDMLAGPSLARNLDALAMDGRIALIAFMAGAESTLNVVPILRKRATITGSTLRPCSVAHKAHLAAALRQEVWPLLERGECLPRIDRTFPLAEAAAAHHHFESLQHVGKLVLDCRST